MSATERKTVLFVLLFYFLALGIFMLLRIKMMEFRWMHILLIFYAFYAMDMMRHVDQKYRTLIFNLSFIFGILFFIAAKIRGY